MWFRSKLAGGITALTALSLAAFGACVPSYDFAPPADGGAPGDARPRNDATEGEAAPGPVDGGVDAPPVVDAPPAVDGFDAGSPPVVIGANEYQGEVCALYQGGYRCFADPNANGNGELGFLGDGAAVVPPVPMPSPNGTPAALVIGVLQSCAIYGRSVLCRGRDYTRGNPSYEGGPGESPVLALPDGGMDLLAAGWATTCAVTTAANAGGQGSVYCWGVNDFGAAGRPPGQQDTTAQAYPVLITSDGGPSSTIPDARAIAFGGDHGCVATASGAVWCWGSDSFYESGPVQQALCDNQYGVYCNTSPQPIALPPGEKATSVALGYNHSCALTLGGAVYCWGQDDVGEVGVASAPDSCVNPVVDAAATPCAKNPVKVPGIPSIQAIAAGGYHTCAIDTNSHVWCWGRKYEGQLGGGDNVTGFGPVEVIDQVLQSAITVDAIAVNGLKSCAHATSGQVLCWGNGELATEAPDAAPPDNNYPAPVRF